MQFLNSRKLSLSSEWLCIFVWCCCRLLFCSSGRSKHQKNLCPTECGNVSIIYPFGIGKGCYFDKGYEVICDHSSGSPKALLATVNKLEILDFSKPEILEYSLVSRFTVQVNVPAISLNSSGKNRTSNIIGKGVIDISGTPFTFSSGNRFIARGCDRENDSSVFGGCLSICTCDPTLYPACYDSVCTLPPRVFNAQTYIDSGNIPQKCQSGFIVEQDWVNNNYLTNPHYLKDQQEVPAMLNWGKEKGMCDEEYNSYSISCNLQKTGCLTQLSSGHVCLCSPADNYSLEKGRCLGRLICNTSSGYDCSKCPDGYDSNPLPDRFYPFSNDLCEKNFNKSLKYRKSRVKVLIIGCSGGLGLFFLLIGIWGLCKFVKRRREIKLKQMFFKKNGGLLLQQQLSSNAGNIEKTKLFTKIDLEKATDNYNANRILGQGGQGTVYKGMLADGGIVAVKKSKLVDESNVEQFINEVVILSQINHRNVVKLLGCCLETEVPLLVYEFIPNGTLYHYLHDQTEEFPITWEMRLGVAVEVSGAMSYLHSAASIPIYHRDIKSSNILLDDKYRAKISDFGASRTVKVDQTHLTTRVQGTFGYLDPEYFQSSQFTEKSDVYSFGVVLVEILTGQKPIRSTNTEEDKSLVGFFLQAMDEDHLFEVLEARVLKEAKEEEIITVAMLAKRCLNMIGKKRPSMKEVAFELGGIRASIGASSLQHNCEEIDFIGGDNTRHSETDYSSTGSILNSVAYSTDADPLISN